MALEFIMTEKDDHLLIELEGKIDEDASFVTIDSPKKLVKISFKNVSAINSCGIREWIGWITDQSNQFEIVFSECPQIIVDQINMIANFLPTNAKMESFQVPYYCEECGIDGSKLYVDGTDFHFEKGSVEVKENIQSEDCDKEDQCEMELDVFESQYFQFIQKKA